MTANPNGVKEDFMLGLILLLIIAVLIIGTIPSWPYSTRWGYRPSGILGLLLILLIVLILIGYIPFIGLEKPILVFPNNANVATEEKHANVTITPEKNTNIPTTITTPDTKAIMQGESNATSR